MLRRFDDLDTYSPAGHRSVLNRLLVGQDLGDGGSVSIWHGLFEPGGRSERHRHEGSVQIYVGIRGSMVVAVGSEEVPLNPLDTVVIPMAEPHAIENRSSEPAEVLVISAPALR